MKSIIASHKIERDELLEAAFVPRHALKRAAPYMTSKRIKVVIGPRRSGKSVFALQMLKAVGITDFAYVNFDDGCLGTDLLPGGGGGGGGLTTKYTNDTKVGMEKGEV
jgi:uncharacterized protein